MTDLRVLVLAPYPLRTAPSQRFRFEQYLEPLRDDGFQIEVSTLLDRDTTAQFNRPGHAAAKAALIARAAIKRVRDVARGRSFDLAFVHREAFPLGFPVFERALAALGTPYIFDLDDAIYLPAVGDTRRFGRLRYPAKTSSIARHARLVTAGNGHLADWAQEYNDDVRLLPTTIDTDLYRPSESGPVTENEAGSLCVGWSGSRTTIRYLEPLAPVLREVQQETGARIRVIGDEGFTIPGAEAEVLPWREETEVADLSTLDIGLMPLTDDEWARGKCGLKALQYMALGIPAVMSPVGVNVEIARGGAALLASSESEWREAIMGLIENRDRREQLGQRGRERVEQAYSVRANLPRYREALSAAAAG